MSEPMVPDQPAVNPSEPAPSEETAPAPAPVTADITWENPIKSYFREKDMTCMQNKFDLSDKDDVQQYSDKIYNKVSSGAMPLGGPPWTLEMCANFKTWMDTSFP